MTAEFVTTKPNPPEPSKPTNPQEPNDPAKPNEASKPIKNPTQTNTPITGDNPHIVLWVTELVLSGAGLMARVLVNKKKRTPSD